MFGSDEIHIRTCSTRENSTESGNQLFEVEENGWNIPLTQREKYLSSQQVSERGRYRTANT